MSCRRPLSALLLAVVLAGCGSGSQERPRSTPAAAPAATAAPEEATDPGPRPCIGRVSKLFGGTVTASVKDVSPGMATCVYKGRQVRVEVQIDTNPQVSFRFERAVVERGQNAVWGHNPRKAPRQIHDLGVGADWFPADRDLLVTDGKRLIDIVLVEGGSLKLTRAIARATLAP